MIQKGEVKSGDIFMTNFDPSVGREFQDIRPALVIQSDQQIKISNVVTILPLTSNLKNRINDDIIIKADGLNHLKSDSIIKVQYIVSSDYPRFINKVGVADADTLELVKQYLKKHLDL